MKLFLKTQKRLSLQGTGVHCKAAAVKPLGFWPKNLPQEVEGKINPRKCGFHP